MALNLNILKYTPPIKSANTGVRYRDLHLDIEKLFTNNKQMFKQNEITDIVADVNANAIKNSIYNILSTMPGQKLLNPEFGLNFTQWLFTNLSETNAYLIRSKIYDQISKYEQRVTLNDVIVTPNYEQNEYHIVISYNNNETFALNLSETGTYIN